MDRYESELSTLTGDYCTKLDMASIAFQLTHRPIWPLGVPNHCVTIGEELYHILFREIYKVSLIHPQIIYTAFVYDSRLSYH